MKTDVRTSFDHFVFPDELTISKKEFAYITNFTNCIFHGGLTSEKVTFLNDVSFGSSRFLGFFKLEHCKAYQGFSMDSCEAARGILYDHCEFMGPASFRSTHFRVIVGFLTCYFDQECDFSHSTYEVSSYDFGAEYIETTFRNAHFLEVEYYCGAKFEKVTFDNCDFQDTQFSDQFTTYFKDIKVENNLLFKSAEGKPPLFKHSVFFTVADEEIVGHIQFENANLSLLSADQRRKLLQLSRTDKVKIGKNCLK